MPNNFRNLRSIGFIIISKISDIEYRIAKPESFFQHFLSLSKRATHLNKRNLQQQPNQLSFTTNATMVLHLWNTNALTKNISKIDS